MKPHLPTWTPDPELVREACSILDTVEPEASIAYLTSDVLREAGRLALLGAEDEVRRRLGQGAALREQVGEALAASSFSALELASIDVLRLAPDLVLDPGRAEVRNALDAALKARDAVELLLIGAETILGSAPELGFEHESYLLEFDGAVRPELWRLVPLNSLRALGLEWMDPQQRPRFWWRFEGSDLPDSALEALADSAALIARFPLVSAWFARLQQGDRRLREAPADPAGMEVVSLSAWLRARRAAAAQATVGEPSLAVGFSEGETVLVSRSDYQISYRPPSALIVDVLMDLAADESPTLLVAGARVGFELVLDCEQRYELVLTQGMLDATSVTLELPGANGEQTVELLHL